MEVLGRYSNLRDQRESIRELLEAVPEGSASVDPKTSKQFLHRLEPNEIDQTRAYESGSTLAEVTRDFQIHRSTAAELLKRTGIPRQM